MPPNQTSYGGEGKPVASLMPYAHGLTGVDIPLDNRLTVALWLTVIIIAIVAFLVRLGQLINGNLRQIMSLRASAPQMTYWEVDHTTIWPWLKRHLFLAPLHKKRHNREIVLSRAMNFGTLPSRLHLLFLAIYLFSNLVYCVLLNYHDNPPQAFIAELRGRTGHLAMVNMVPLILLAGRNNPLIPILRISFDTYNLFHRWIGRLVVIEAIVHTIAWSVNAKAADGGNEGMVTQHLTSDSFLLAGLIATLSMSVILIQSPSAIRHAFYETFLHCHQLLALAAVIGVWVHCDLGDLPAKSYIRWAAALWVFERCMRLTRLIYHNISHKEGMSKVTIEALPGDGTSQACRVSVELVRPLNFTPGTHAYIYIPSLSFWMNHPFSIAWSSATLSPSPVPAPPRPPRSTQFYHHDFKDGIELKPSTHSRSSSLSTTNKLPLPSNSPPTVRQTLHFVIAKRTGLTRALFDAAYSSPSRRTTVSGLLEGPYSTNTSTSSILPIPLGTPSYTGSSAFSSYGTVLLFAGGVGITHHLPHLRSLLQAHANSACATRQVHLVWTVRSTDAFEWVREWMDQLLSLPNRKQVLRIMLYVSKGGKGVVMSRSETVKMFPGRPDVKSIVGRVVRERVGAVGVCVCGPGGLGDDVRAAVREILAGGEGDMECAESGRAGKLEGVPTVDIVEEAFTW